MECRRAITLIHPLNDALALFIRDDCSFSLVYESFLKLLKHPAYTQPSADVSGSERNAILELIKERWNFVYSKSLGFAYLLDQTKSTAAVVGRDLQDTIEQAVTIMERMGLPTGITTNEFGAAIVRLHYEKASWTDEEKRRSSFPRTTKDISPHHQKKLNFPAPPRETRIFCISPHHLLFLRTT
ncbi:hypothetical protein ROZALSC1DRAFT_28826 [Rozella allomycis CSF55]|uniref:Uncharacterized protein n=1 Tax=Rozella allomycis (strain CSF55) TaxID=988480 RepID=A0A075AUU9_ROZAC|nr:hypothetical protein O9G_004993 [Rozella allomycis CSF55]RKP19595.1 hypothetical protein ROZALSC1DRAFT_28826 [Rozella allomycis CSF55]|eukprot:EPZ34056.1 hypothetical protein O9G_004993 [Rozella allomycis CSF55]